MSFNKDLDYFGGSDIHNGSGIIIEKIMGLNQSSSFDFNNISGDTFKKVNSAEKGDYGVYTESNKYDGVDLKNFIPSDKKKAIYIKYKIQNI